MLVVKVVFPSARHLVDFRQELLKFSKFILEKHFQKLLSLRLPLNGGEKEKGPHLDLGIGGQRVIQKRLQNLLVSLLHVFSI